ncbi:hypothetical protein L3049_04945 [Labilibaculum sp. DW002]|uniref:Uncharacterized protein n=1 Tax=Paralabilibaculum antarcticum TaxID=2912572 RepID=A0ABT5VPI9_9BACT|nr:MULTISPECIES: hypothetical protein [unclassified Labilibaculum]MBI9059853.1 hypothetical protein [Labilibaculum sp.]MDE5417349.1 hypothetical protein [Labilibaculum sp. DW002]
MKDLIEIFKYIIPSLVVFATAYLLIKAFLKQEERKIQHQILLKNNKQITPIRLQACERLLLFLERIHPESLIIRENTNGLNNLQFQQKLIIAIRTEFEHNLAQQLYVTDESWVKIKNAKNSIVQLINTEAAQIAKEDPSIVLSKAVIESHMQQQKPAIEIAISSLKAEVQVLWG